MPEKILCVLKDLFEISHYKIISLLLKTHENVKNFDLIFINLYIK